MAIGWRLANFGVVNGGGESSPCFLGGFGGPWFVSRCLDSFTSSRLLVWLASLWVEIAARIPGGDYADARRMSKEVKLVWFWKILNFSFVLVF